MLETDRQPSTKISRPLADPVFPRERLYKELDRARKRPLVWIEGPGGSGKTTLVSGYVDSRELDCLWYRIDPDDDDPATFFYYMGMAGKLAGSDGSSELSLFTPENMLSVGQFSRRFFGDLFPLLKTPGVVVLDNFENVPQESYLVQVLQQAITRIPGDVRLFVVSRLAPPGDLARLRANRKLQHMAWDDLQLDLEECNGILEVHGLQDIPRDDVARLNERVDGWVAGLTLIAESMDGKGVLPEESEVASREVTFEYYAAEVWKKLDSSVRELLLKVCFFPRMTADMALSISGSEEAPAILEQLAEGNLFTVRLSGEPSYYQFHALFREFLQAGALRELGPESVKELQNKTAAILTVEGNTEDAIRLYIEAEDWDSAANLVKMHAQAVFQQCRFRTLQDWIGSLPEDLLDSDPWLQYWMGSTTLFINPPLSREWFNKAYDRFSKAEDVAGIYLSWTGIVNAVFHGLTSYASFDRLLEEMDKVRIKYPDYPSQEIEAMVSSAMLTVLTMRNPSHPDILSWADRAIGLLGEQSNHQLEAMTVHLLANHYCWTGDFSKAEMIINSAKTRFEEKVDNPLITSMMSNVAAIVLWVTSRFEECRILVENALKTSRETGVHIWDFYLLGHSATSALCEGDVDFSGSCLKKMEHVLLGPSAWDKSYFHFLSAWRAMLLVDLNLALEHGKKSLSLAKEVGNFAGDFFTILGMSEICWELEDCDKALEYLKDATHIAKKINSPYFQYMVETRKVWFALENDDEEIVDTIRNLMALGKRGGFSNFYFWRPEVMSGICAQALKEEIEVEYVRGLIKKRHLKPAGELDDLDAWPWPVRIYTMGRFEVVVNDESLRPQARGKQKQLDLLKVIIALGGRKVPVEQICDALWPDADGAAAHQSFTVTLHRLRKWIGVDEALILREGSVSLNSDCCWVDSWALERLLSRLANALEKVQAGDDASLDQLAAKLIGMYPGQFMAGDTHQPWAIARSERLRNRFLRTAGTYCRHLQSMDRHEEATELYRKLIEIDPVAEDLYQSLMNCFLNLGRQAEGIKVYRSCSRVLDEVLGTSPSAKTEEICRQLRSMS